VSDILKNPRRKKKAVSPDKTADEGEEEDEEDAEEDEEPKSKKEAASKKKIARCVHLRPAPFTEIGALVRRMDRTRIT
jgi:hypothetical protein